MESELKWLTCSDTVPRKFSCSSVKGLNDQYQSNDRAIIFVLAFNHCIMHTTFTITYCMSDVALQVIFRYVFEY